MRVPHTVQTATQADGLEITFSAFGDGAGQAEYLNTNQNVSLIINNGSGAERTVTYIDKKGTYGKAEATISDKTYTVPTGAIFVIPPQEQIAFNDSSNNLVDVDIDDDTSVTAAAVIITSV